MFSVQKQKEMTDKMKRAEILRQKDGQIVTAIVAAASAISVSDESLTSLTRCTASMGG